MNEGVERAAKRRFPHQHLVQGVQKLRKSLLRSSKRKHWNMAKAPWPRYHSRWQTAGEDQRIGDLSLLSGKRWTCGKFTNLVPFGCSSESCPCCTKAVRKLILLFQRLKKAGRSHKSCIGSWLSQLLVAVTRQPQRFLVFSVCIRRARILN